MDARGSWALYSENFILSGKGGFEPKAPQTWLQSTPDDFADRTDELDVVLGWAEAQTDQFSMLRCVKV